MSQVEVCRMVYTRGDTQETEQPRATIPLRHTCNSPSSFPLGTDPFSSIQATFTISSSDRLGRWMCCTWVTQSRQVRDTRSTLIPSKP